MAREKKLRSVRLGSIRDIQIISAERYKLSACWVDPKDFVSPAAPPARKPNPPSRRARS